MDCKEYNRENEPMVTEYDEENRALFCMATKGANGSKRMTRKMQVEIHTPNSLCS